MTNVVRIAPAGAKPRPREEVLAEFVDEVGECGEHVQLMTSGVLRPAVEAYLQGHPMTLEQVAAMRAYLRQWINDPEWVGGEALENLRAAIDRLDGPGAISQWLALAEIIGVDPLSAMKRLTKG